MEQGFCFVIMPFKDEMKGVYEGAIKPAVESLGLECIRVDEIDGSGNVVRRIIERIHEAKAVIADLTGKSANVFYELGILDPQVFFACNSSSIDFSGVAFHRGHS